MSQVTHPQTFLPRQSATRWLRAALFWLPAIIVVTLTVSACGGGGSGSGNTPAPSSSAVIGTAGGTLTGPDSVQVTVPAGAVDGDTTFAITRTSAGAPALPAGMASSQPIYEFTPHDLTFNQPVLIRIPVTGGASGTSVIMASRGEEWTVRDATPNNGMAEFQRNTFSWGMIGLDCAFTPNDPNLDPSGCIWPSGAAAAQANPAQAMTRTVMPWPNTGSAGTYQISQAATINLRLVYTTAYNCQNSRVVIKRKRLDITPAQSYTTILDQAVSLTDNLATAPFRKGSGTTNFSLPFTNADNGRHAFRLTFACNRPGQTTSTKADILVIESNIAAPAVFHTVGGSVSGLTGTGLVLQNNFADNLAVSANGSFTFATAIPAASNYSVSVLTQPTGQTCAVQTGSGTASADVSNVAVTCTAIAGGIALVANSSSNTLSIYWTDPGTGALTANGSTGTGAYPYAIAMTPNGLFAYVTNLVSGTVNSYSINTTTGAVGMTGNSVGSVNPYGIAMDPLGRFVWVANFSANTVSAYTINGSTGQIVAAGSPVPTGTHPYDVAAHPSGNYVYVTNESGNSVSAFSVNTSSGQLTQIGTPAVGTVAGPHGLVVDPSGHFVYVAEAGGDTVTVFSINAGTGALARLGFTRAGSLPNAVAVHPNGQFVYAANQSSNNVSVFSINSSTGLLTAVGSPVAAGSGPTALKVNAAGTYLYVANLVSNTTSTYSINSGTGVLTPLGAATATGSGPQGIAITP